MEKIIPYTHALEAKKGVRATLRTLRRVGRFTLTRLNFDSTMGTGSTPEFLVPPRMRRTGSEILRM